MCVGSHLAVYRKCLLVPCPPLPFFTATQGGGKEGESDFEFLLVS